MRRKTYLRLVERQEEQARRHLDEVRGIYKEMRGYKHDFHHHLQALKGQLEAGQTDRAIQYITELGQALQSVDTLLKTGNITVDAIFFPKLAKAWEEGIAVTVQAQVPAELLLTDLELSILLGMKGSMLYFHMLNAAGKKKQKRGSLFSTSKAGFHGFGLHRAQAIVKEHGGWCKFNSEDGAFSSEFLVPAVEPKSEYS